MRKPGLTLAVIKGRRLPGAATGPDGTVLPLYTTDATGPDVTHYLVIALEEALALLDEASTVVDQDLGARITQFRSRV